MDINCKNQCNGRIEKVLKEKDAVHNLEESYMKLLEENEKIILENRNLTEKICNLEEKICNLKIEAVKSDKVITTIILEKSVLEEKLKDNMKLIHSFAERTVEARKAPGQKSISKLCKEFQKVDTNLNLWYSDVLTVTSLVQDIQANCNDCRAKHKKDKETYENTIKSLENCKINNEFLIQQLTHQVNKYSEEILNLKREKENLSKKDKDKTKEVRFSGSMPPTPESFTNSHDSEESMQTQLSASSLFSEQKLVLKNSNSNSKPSYTKVELSSQFCNDQNSHLETAKSDKRISPTCQTHDIFSVTKMGRQKSSLNKSDNVKLIPNDINMLEEYKIDIKPVCKSEEFTMQNDLFGYISADSEEDDNFEVKKPPTVENVNTNELRLVNKTISKITTEENNQNKPTLPKKLLEDNISKVSCEQNTQDQTDHLPLITKRRLIKQADSDLLKDEKSVAQVLNKSPPMPGTLNDDDFDAICKHFRMPKLLSPIYPHGQDKKSIKVEKKAEPLETDKSVMAVLKGMPDQPPEDQPACLADQKPEKQLDDFLASTLTVTQELECYSVPKIYASKSIFSPESMAGKQKPTFEKSVEESSSLIKNPELQLESVIKPKIQSENNLEKITENSDGKLDSLDKQPVLNQLPVTSLNCDFEDRNISSIEFSPNEDEVNLKEVNVSSVIESISKSPNPFEFELEIKNLSNNSGFQELLNLDQEEPAISAINADYKDKNGNSKENNSQIDLFLESQMTNLLNSSIDETFIVKLLNDDDKNMPLDLSFNEDCEIEKNTVQETTPNEKPMDFSSPSKLQKSALISTAVSVSPDSTTASPNTKSPVLEKLPSSFTPNVSTNTEKCKKLNIESSHSSTKDVNLNQDLEPRRSPEGVKHDLRTNLSPTAIHYQQCSPKSPNSRSKKSPKGGGKSPLSAHFINTQESPKISSVGPRTAMTGLNKANISPQKSPENMKRSPDGMKMSPCGMKMSSNSIERSPVDMKRPPKGMNRYSLRPLSLPNYCDIIPRVPRSAQLSPKSLKLDKSCKCNKTAEKQSINELSSLTKNQYSANEKYGSEFFLLREVRGLQTVEQRSANTQPVPENKILSIKTCTEEDSMPVDYTNNSVYDKTSFGELLQQSYPPIQESELSTSKTVIGDKLYSPNESSCKSINSTIQQGDKENSQRFKLQKGESNCQSSSSSIVMEENQRSAKKHILQHKGVLNTYLRRKALKFENKNIKLIKHLDTATRKIHIKKSAISKSLNCNKKQGEAQNINTDSSKTLHNTLDIDLKTDAYLKSNVTCNQDDLFPADGLSTSYPRYSNALLCMPFKKSNTQRSAGLTVESCKTPCRKSYSENRAGKIKTRLSREALKWQNLIWTKLLVRRRRRCMQSDPSPLHSPIPLTTIPDKDNQFPQNNNNLSSNKILLGPLHTTPDDKVLISVKSSENNSLTSKTLMSIHKAFTPSNVVRTYTSKLKLKKEDKEQITNTCPISASEINQKIHFKPQQSQAEEDLNSQSPDRLKVKSFGNIVLDFSKKENLTYFKDLNLILDNIGVQPKSASNKDTIELNINNVSVVEQGIGLSNHIKSGSKATSSLVDWKTDVQYFRNKASKLKKNQDVADYLNQSCKIIKHIESKVKISEEKKSIFPSKKRKIFNNKPDLIPDKKNSTESCYYQSTLCNTKRSLLELSSLAITEEKIKLDSTAEKDSNHSMNAKLPMNDSIFLKSTTSSVIKDLPQTSAPNLDSSVPTGSPVDNKRITHFVKGPTIPATITSSIQPITLNPSETEPISTTKCSLSSIENDNILAQKHKSSGDRPELNSEDSTDSEDQLVMDVDEELLVTLDSICSTNHGLSPKAAQLDDESRGNSNVAKSFNDSLFVPKTQKKTNIVLGEIEGKLLTPELSYAPSNLKPLPKAMYRYEEKLIKTNVDFSRPQNITPSFSFYQPSSTSSVSNDIRTQLTKEDPGEAITPNSSPDNKDFSLKFYTESNPGMKLKEETTDPQNANVEESVFKFPNHIGYKKKPLEEFLPKGAKVKVTGNVLRTAFSIHGENLIQYVTRNVTEQRKTIKPCPAKDLRKTEDILQPLITSDIANLVELCQIAESLKSFECRAIFTGLVLALKNEIERLFKEKGNDKFSSWIFNIDRPNEPLPNHRSPVVHPRVQALVTLITLIDGRKEESTKLKSGFIEESIDFLEKMFFGSVEKQQNSGHVEVLVFLGFVYTCLARLRGELVRVRRTMYDLLYCFTKTGLSLSYCILRTWPAVLRVMPIENYYGDPLALAVIHALTRQPPSAFPGFTRHKIYSCHSLLRHKYKFTSTTTDGDQLFDMFLSRLCQQDVHEAMILLAKNQSTDWFKRRPKKQLMEVVQRWRQNGDGEMEAAAAINILGCVCRSFRHDDMMENNSLIELLRDILQAETTPFWMQELVVLNLCRLARIDWQFCITVITSWRPTQMSSEIIDKIIIDIISKRSPMFWRSPTGLQLLNSR